jgi:hypothetical protein
MRGMRLGVLLALVACDSRPAVVVGKPVYLYGSASACHASAHAGPDDSVRRRKLEGVSTTLVVGTKFSIVAEDLGKEFACWRVEGHNVRGYVLASERISAGPRR